LAAERPCIDTAFGPTAAHSYWTSTDFGHGLTWAAFFGNSDVNGDGATDHLHVRAVRGGL
jgi:hypothetical protein